MAVHGSSAGQCQNASFRAEVQAINFGLSTNRTAVLGKLSGVSFGVELAALVASEIGSHSTDCDALTTPRCGTVSRRLAP